MAKAGFGARGLEVHKVHSSIEYGAANTEDEREEVEDRSGDEVVPGRQTEVAVDPEEEGKYKDSDVVGHFEKLVTVASMGCVNWTPLGALMDTHLMGPILMILRYA
jgi:hypothetical protein